MALFTRYPEGQPNGAVPVSGLPAPPFPYLGSPTPHFQGGSLSNLQPRVPNRNAQQPPPSASRLALEGLSGPGTVRRGRNHSDGPGPASRQVSEEGFCLSLGQTLCSQQAGPWARGGGAASYQSNQCSPAEQGLLSGGSPSPSLGGQAGTSPPGGHRPARGSKAAEDTGLTLRLLVQRRTLTPFPLSPPAFQSLLLTNASISRAEKVVHTPNCAVRDRRVTSSQPPPEPGPGLRDSPVPPAQRPVERLLGQ